MQEPKGANKVKCIGKNSVIRFWILCDDVFIKNIYFEGFVTKNSHISGASVTYWPQKHIWVSSAILY